MNRRELQSSGKAIAKDIAKLIEDCRTKELPRNKNRQKRNGNGSPLVAWMAGTSKREQSKIEAVTNGRATFGYCTFSSAYHVIAQRIAKKRQLTSVQYELLLQYISHRYRGRLGSELSYRYYSFLIDSGVDDALVYETKDLMVDIAGGKEIPLCAILSSRLTDLLLIFQLYTAARKAN